MVANFFTVATVLASAASVFAEHSLYAWSSPRSNALDVLPANINSGKFIEQIVQNDEMCDFDAVVFVQEPGAHHIPSYHVARSISSAPSARSFNADTQLDLLPTAKSISSRCNSRLLNYTPGPSSSGVISFEEGRKHVVCIEMPKALGVEETDIDAHDSTLSSELATITSVFPSHFIIYSGSANIYARQAPDVFTRPVIENMNSNSNISSSKDTTAQQQATVFFTTGLVTSLLIVFFILLPALMMGISALASIQTPTRMDAPKGYNAVEKKNQ